MSQLKNIISIQQGGTPVPPYTVLDHCYFNNSPVSLGFKLTDAVTLLKISFTAQNSNWIFGARDYQTSSERFTIQASSSGNGVVTNNISASTTTNINNLLSRIDYSYDGSTVTIVNNENTYTSTNTRGFANGSRNLVIGCIRNGANIVSSNYMKGYFWKLEIYEGTLAHNIIPIRDQNNVICLYDTVAGGDYKYPSTGTLQLDEPVGLNMINPGSLQMGLGDNFDLDVEPNEDEDI